MNRPLADDRRLSTAAIGGDRPPVNFTGRRTPVAREHGSIAVTKNCL